MTNEADNPARWLPDPTGRHEYRYWNGSSWADDVANKGVTGQDPLAAAPVATPVPDGVAPEEIATSTSERTVESSLLPADEPAPTQSPSPSPARKSWYKRKLVWAAAAIVVLLVIAAIAGGGSSDNKKQASAPDTPSATKPSAITTSPKATAAPPTTFAPTTNPPPPTTSAVPHFGDGTLLVGTNIQPGIYIATPSAGCYWARLSGLTGDLSQIVANGNEDAQVIVQIAPSDVAFESRNCGTWQLYAPPAAPPATRFGPGFYTVNQQIAPGRYQSSGGTSCYWQRLANFSGAGTDGILANDNVDGPTVVDITVSDAGFSSKNCGSWTKID